MINGSVGGCHKVLKDLFEMGLITKQVSGRNLYYRIKEDNPAIEYFKIFINIQEINREINELFSECKRIILYGSCATGEDTFESDIDILIITENVKTIKQKLKNKYINGRELKPIVLLPHDFIKLKDNDPAFYNEINKGIIIWRDTSE
jgi:predicted nucleotidyltransferase